MANLPGPLALFARVTAPLRNGAGRPANEAKLSEALTSLGPSYIKLGQFLATRDDMIGRELARDLSTLQDRLPPFSQGEARAAVEEALGRADRYALSPSSVPRSPPPRSRRCIRRKVRMPTAR